MAENVSSSSLLTIFRREFDDVPKLEKDSEDELRALLLAQAGDEEAFRQVLGSLLETITYLAWGYSKLTEPVLDTMDLTQEAITGLMHAIRRFEPGGNFRAFAKARIQGKIIDAIRTMRPGFSGTGSIYRKVYKLKRTVKDLAVKLGRDPKLNEISEKTGMKESKVSELLAFNLICVSLDGDEEGTNLVRRIAAEEQSPFEKCSFKQLKARIRLAKRFLSADEEAAIDLFYGFSGRVFNMWEIGVIMGLTESRISQILKRAHEELRKPEYKLSSFLLAE
jgi:RNA polymerase sigma factor (sigma-70 family)